MRTRLSRLAVLLDLVFELYCRGSYALAGFAGALAAAAIALSAISGYAPDPAELHYTIMALGLLYLVPVLAYDLLRMDRCERGGVADLVLSQPVGRGAYLAAKVLAFVVLPAVLYVVVACLLSMVMLGGLALDAGFIIAEFAAFMLTAAEVYLAFDLIRLISGRRWLAAIFLVPYSLTASIVLSIPQIARLLPTGARAIVRLWGTKLALPALASETVASVLYIQPYATTPAAVRALCARVTAVGLAMDVVMLLLLYSVYLRRGVM